MGDESYTLRFESERHWKLIEFADTVILLCQQKNNEIYKGQIDIYRCSRIQASKCVMQDVVDSDLKHSRTQRRATVTVSTNHVRAPPS